MTHAGRRQLCQAALLAGVQLGHYPGAVVIWGCSGGIDDMVVAGTRADASPMHADVVFDLASLTKPLVLGTALASMVDAGTLQADAKLPAAVSVPACLDRDRVTIAQLASHQSGLNQSKPADLSSAEACWDDWLARTRCLSEPGTRFQYSCLGAVLLGQYIEQRCEADCASLTRTLIAKPLQLASFGYHPDPAELDIEPGIPGIEAGLVSDEAARGLRGAVGNAGLFASARELAQVVSALLAVARGGEQLPLSAAGLQYVWAKVPGSIVDHAWMWDRNSPSASVVRPSWMGRQAIGHGGFTGQGIWIDPDQDRFVVICTNRQHDPSCQHENRFEHAMASARFRGVIADSLR